MFAVFGAVKQFPLLLTVFSYEFYTPPKHAKKPLKLAKVRRSRGSRKDQICAKVYHLRVAGRGRM
jgi:hypothetical protein